MIRKLRGGLLVAMVTLVELSGLLAARAQAGSSTSTATLRFAVLGDYGVAYLGGHDQDHEQAVAQLIQNWAKDSAGLAGVITLGDNNYDDNDKSIKSFDIAAGQFYCNFMANYQGTLSTNGWKQTCGSSTQEFFPVPGNHDYKTTTGASDSGYAGYDAYFPGAHTGGYRFYDFGLSAGGTELVHFFALNSNCPATDASQGNHGCPDSSGDLDCLLQYAGQQAWLNWRLPQTSAVWNLPYFHHPPYSIGSEGGCQGTADWKLGSTSYKNANGTHFDAVLAGHSHTYQRILLTNAPNLPFFVNGAGGKSMASCQCSNGPTGMGSGYCYDNHQGAMLVTATATTLTLEFYNLNGTLEDSVTITRNTDGSNTLSCATKLDACSGATLSCSSS